MSGSHTSTATVVTDDGYQWSVEVEVAAIDEVSRARIDGAIRDLVAVIMDGRGHDVEVTVPDHPALARM